jgi:hypothetical protein
MQRDSVTLNISSSIDLSLSFSATAFVTKQSLGRRHGTQYLSFLNTLRSCSTIANLAQYRKIVFELLGSFEQGSHADVLGHRGIFLWTPPRTKGEETRR